MPAFTAKQLTELAEAAYQYDQLSQKVHEAYEFLVKIKADLDLTTTRAQAAKGRLRELLSKSDAESLPFTIALTGTDRLLTVYESEDDLDRSFVITSNISQ